MGASCSATSKNNGTVSPRNNSNINAKSSMFHDQIPSQKQFKFVLNDQEILLSPKSPPFSDNYLSPSTSMTTAFVFQLDTEDENEIEQAMEIPMYQLRNTVSNFMEWDVEHRYNSNTTRYESTDEPLEFNQDYQITPRLTDNDSQTASHPSLSATSNSISVPKRKPNLYRSADTASWELRDIKELQMEMKEQMHSLSKDNLAYTPIKSESGTKSLLFDALDDSDSDSEYIEYIMSYDDYSSGFQHNGGKDNRQTLSLYGKHTETDTMTTFNWTQTRDDTNDGHVRRGSNLVQTLSCDWESEDLEIEEDQMKKHLDHLKNENNINTDQSNKF